MIEAFTTYNQYNDNRLIIDTLIVLNNAKAYQYLGKILAHPENKKAFTRDFHFISLV